MANVSAITFARLADGTLLRRQDDGTFRTVTSETDRTRLSTLTDAQIEAMADAESDHPTLDDSFWDDIEASKIAKEVISIKLDSDVLGFFREAGQGYQARINAVLRRYMTSRRSL